jgi:hypothetical protein
MWKVPRRYKAVCVNEAGKEIFNKEIEAINVAEAKSRTFLNCMLINDKKKNFNVKVVPL